MRPIVLLIIFVIVAFCIQVDLTSGTIPISLSENEGIETDEVSSMEEEVQVPLDLPYQMIIVEPGQTVYGIVQELHHQQSFAVPIHEVLEDFELLNPGVSAHQLLAHEQYKFPLYENEDNITN